jgi:hypothetical protein
MPPSRTAILNLRVDPALKDALRTAANREHRSVANMVEWLVRKHCAKTGISIPEQTDLSLEETGERKRT